MATPREIEAKGPARDSRRSARPLDWSRLLKAETTETALTEIARWLGPDVLRINLSSEEPTGGCGTELAVNLAPGCSKRPDLVGRATLAFDAWREARRELEQAEARLAARSAELDLIQAVGRRAAEARTLPELFSSTIAVIHQGVPLDLALTAHREDRGDELQLFSTRPFDESYLAALELRARRFLGEALETATSVERTELDGYDPARSAERTFREEDLLLLPLMSRGTPVACWIVVPATNLEERQLRLLYSTSNQLSLHLERITAVRAAEAGRFRTVVDSMPQGVLLSADGERVAHANRAAREMLRSVGCSPDDRLESILPRIGAQELALPLRRTSDDLPDRDVAVEGDRVWNLTVAPLRGDPGRPSGVVLVMADVTERRRLQEQLAQSEKMSSLGQMISGVAHELNNPLASILGYAQLLKMRGGTGELAGKLDTLAREAQRCRKIVENLLFFARRRAPERKPLSLNQVVENVVALMRYQLRVDDVTLELELSAELPVLHGDAHQLEQALVNLLTNARHAIHESGSPGTVTVRTRPSGPDAVLLEVEDTGSGVPESERSKIFDPFYTTKRIGEGTGLGLALVYGIVADHGGTIEVRQGNGGGARFVAALPVGRSEEIAARSPERISPDSGCPGRILIVDDEEPLAEMISDVLVGDGHRTTVFLDARRALEHIADEPYDLIISDLKMPGMKGDALHAAVKRLRPEMSDSVLLTTGDTLGDEPAEIAARTGLELLSKPFDLDELRRRVRARLALRKPRP